MSEAYVECLVKAKSSNLKSFLKYFMYMMTVASVAFFVLFYQVLALLLAVAFGVGAYFAGLYADVEYEYLYMDKELTVDRILGKSKRKTMAVYNLEKIEIFAPIKSYHLDGFKNRQCQTIDYSVGYEDQPDRRYVMYIEGNLKLIMSPSEELVKIMKNMAPRKIFND